MATTFDPGAGADGQVWAVALQTNGKVLIGGAFTNFNGVAHKSIARLNPDGSIDSSFNPAKDGRVFSILLQPDGKILLAGDFLTGNGLLRRYVARLYGDFATPALNIARSNGFVVLSWPAAFGNHQLQENTNLLLSNGWSAVGAPSSTNNNFISVTLPATNRRKFFRLNSP
jgi:hypothetical protein